MNSRILLLIGFTAIASVAFANSDFINISNMMSLGASGDLPMQCTVPLAVDPPITPGQPGGTGGGDDHDDGNSGNSGNDNGNSDNHGNSGNSGNDNGNNDNHGNSGNSGNDNGNSDNHGKSGDSFRNDNGNSDNHGNSGNSGNDNGNNDNHGNSGGPSGNDNGNNDKNGGGGNSDNDDNPGAPSTDPSKLITITIPFKTSGAVTGVALGTVTLPITFTSSVSSMSVIGTASISFTSGSGILGGSESDFISPTSGTSATITDSGITVTTAGAATGTITISETVSGTVPPPATILPLITPLATPLVSGTGPGLNVIICPTVVATLT